MFKLLTISFGRAQVPAHQAAKAHVMNHGYENRDFAQQSLVSVQQRSQTGYARTAVKDKVIIPTTTRVLERNHVIQ